MSPAPAMSQCASYSRRLAVISPQKRAGTRVHPNRPTKRPAIVARRRRCPPGPARKRGSRVSRLGGCLPCLAAPATRRGSPTRTSATRLRVVPFRRASPYVPRVVFYAGSSVFAFFAGVCALHVSAWTRCGGQKKWGVAVFPPTCSGTYTAGDPVWCTGAHRRGQGCVCGPV